MRDFYLRQDGAPPHYHQHGRAYLDDTLPGRWIGRRGVIEYPPRPPDLRPLDLYLWGTLKDEVYPQKPATLNALRETITPDTLTAAVGRHRRCLAADGSHSLSLRAEIVTTCHFVPKILTIKE
jgi:hypothetical protein